MNNLIACQPGWIAVFHDADGEGYETEPVACWNSVYVNAQTEVHPMCALGGDICDATLATNYIGVVGPGSDPRKLFDAYYTSKSKPAA